MGELGGSWLLIQRAEVGVLRPAVLFVLVGSAREQNGKEEGKRHAKAGFAHASGNGCAW